MTRSFAPSAAATYVDDPPSSRRAAPLILNVNDNEGARYLVSLMLKKAGFRVIDVSTGEAALEAVGEHHPDLLVLDVKLPGIDGFEVCRRIRATHDSQRVKILHTSATYVALESKIQSLDNGADGYLMQPYEPEELVATVRSLLRLNDAEQALVANAEQLREADRRKDEFLAMLAHELRNPLAAITASLPLIERRGPMDDVEARAREVLHRQANHLKRLVDELLDVARVTRGKIDLHSGVVDLGGLVTRVAEMVEETRTGARKQRLLRVVPSEPILLRGDPTRLEQIVVNLLDNASKYTDVGGTIEISVLRDATDSSTAILRVRDDGIGIAPEALSTVFGLFSQVEVPLARSRGGLGIGLTLAHTLASLHGGTLTAKSAGPGKGSEFEVRLPAMPPQPKNDASAVNAVSDDDSGEDLNSLLTPGRRRKVLVVEDSIDVQEMLKELFEMWGHDVVCASDGLSGVARALEFSPDVALVDIGLPGIDGYEVVRRIRSTPQGRTMMIVAMTGYGAAEEKARGQEAGFDVHLVKPVKATRLAALLDGAARPTAVRAGACA